LFWSGRAIRLSPCPGVWNEQTAPGCDLEQTLNTSLNRFAEHQIIAGFPAAESAQHQSVSEGPAEIAVEPVKPA